jgi:hypothetical protein
MYAYYAYFRMLEEGLNEVGTEEKFLSHFLWYAKDRRYNMLRQKEIGFLSNVYQNGNFYSGYNVALANMTLWACSVPG